MNTMLYQGYLAEIELDEQGDLLRGVVVNAHEPYRFSAKTISKLRHEFARATAEYQSHCAQNGRETREFCPRPIAAERHQKMLQSAKLIGRKRPRGAPDYWTLQQAYDEWLTGLCHAHKTFTNASDNGREGVKLACEQTALFIARRWENPELASAFLHLHEGLSDVQDGRYPEIFDSRSTPRLKSRSRFGHHHTMFAAALLDAQVQLQARTKKGEPLKELAKRAADKISRWPHFKARDIQEETRVSAQTIINWRNSELAKRPRDRQRFDTVVKALLSEANPKSAIDRFFKTGPPSAPKPAVEET